MAVARLLAVSSRRYLAIPPRRSPSAAQTAPAQIPKIAIAPIIGAPDTVAKQLQTQLTTAIETQKVTVARPPNDKGELTLRGYIVSAKEKTKTKVSYIWDVTDQTGKRVHRITGEEIVAGAQGKDPWASVSPQIVDTIANKTTASLTTWLPTQSQPATAATTPPVARRTRPCLAATQTPAPQSTAAVTAPPPRHRRPRLLQRRPVRQRVASIATMRSPRWAPQAA